MTKNNQPLIEDDEVEVDDEPVVGMSLNKLLGNSAKVVSESGLRKRQMGNALANQQIDPEFEDDDGLQADFHKAGVPEQIAAEPDTGLKPELKRDAALAVNP